jgi:glutamine amidotransferase-like uncharacterized protein
MKDFCTRIALAALVACSAPSPTRTGNDDGPQDRDAAASGSRGNGPDGGDSGSPATTGGDASSDGAAAEIKPLALVYRGPGTCDATGGGCAAAWAAMFTHCQPRFTVEYVGPAEAQDVTAAALAAAGVFIYPGGNDSLAADWTHVKSYKAAIQSFVRGGGRYLGSCTGGYLAGINPWAGDGVGFQLLPGEAGEYVTSPGATITTTRDTVVNVLWPSVGWTSPHPIYFQDGAYFAASNGVTVLATFAGSDEIAALVAPYGAGKVGVEGPHAEAPADWYSANAVPGAPDFTPGCDLVAKALAP